MKRIILEESSARGFGGIDIIGPAPTFIHRLRGRYRWQLIIRGQNLSAFLSQLTFAVGWMVDVDPMNLIQ